MNLLDKLFKPATTVKPQELNYKHCRTDWGEGSMPILYVRDHKEGKGVFTDDLSKEFILSYSDVQYLDDSDEAVKALYSECIPVSKDGREPESIQELFEINFLKEHDLYQINDMFRQLNEKLRLLQREGDTLNNKEV